MLMINTSNRSTVSSVPPTPQSECEILQSSNLKSFSFFDLKTATRNFRPDIVFGEGSFGSVFKGRIDEQYFVASKPGTDIVIAVKKLNQESFQGHKEWPVEVIYCDFKTSNVLLDSGEPFKASKTPVRPCATRNTKH